MENDTFGMFDKGLDFGIFDQEKPQKTKTTETKEKRRTVACLELSLKYLYKRAHSETQLLDCFKDGFFDPKEGQCYNFITGGDVDALSYLKLILRKQTLNHCLLSTWCIATEDVLQVFEWVKEKKILKLDLYLGEIFPNQYKIEYKMVKDFYIENKELGRFAVFKNHSKVIAGTGNAFDFGCQTSANVNTNPRTENGCITIDKGLYNFYKEYFDGIKSFEK